MALLMSASVVLIVVSGGDIASTNQADALLAKPGWQKMDNVEGRLAYSNQHVRMWWVEDGVLGEDDLDLRWQQSTGEVVEEVVFPSRHAAASGQACLTLHPIGIPQVAIGDEIPYGGKAQSCPPPSSRIAAWWRELQNTTPESICDKFDLSLEVTHHGPWLSVPCLFIEVGSTAENWPHQGAADVLADIIWRGLGLDGGNGFGAWDESIHSGQPVMVTLGGGHYAPRGNKTASIEGAWLGHMLANYALPFIAPEQEGGPIGGRWSDCIDEAIRSTRIAFPGCQIVLSMDKKSFRGWQRQAIRDYAADNQIPLIKTKQYEELLQESLG